MSNVHVYDPPMCCATGICGPSVDPRLVRFGADLDWLKGQGASVERFNLSQQPGAFVSDVAIKTALETLGEEALPLVMVDGKVRSAGTYPSREELAAWAGLEAPVPIICNDAVSELVAIGAAVASNCEPCFKFHYDKARKLGVSDEDMLRAVRMAQAVTESPAKAVLLLAEKYLTRQKPETEADSIADDNPDAESLEAEEAGCCGPSEAGEAVDGSSGGCC